MTHNESKKPGWWARFKAWGNERTTDGGPGSCDPLRSHNREMRRELELIRERLEAIENAIASQKG